MKGIFILFVILLVIKLPCQAQLDSTEIDQVVQKFVTKDTFEGTILIAENGKPVYHKSFGFRDFNQDSPVENTNRFSIASITKLFTAIAIMQLVDEGKLQLTDNLYKLLPEYKIPKARRITIHHLLLHISGLPHENGTIYGKENDLKTFIIETLENERQAIGSFNYANIDYVLLGLIIEKIDQQSWKASIQKRILDKVGMKNTGFLAFLAYPDNFAYSFSFNENGTRLKDPKFFIENFYAAGCMYSTAADLLQLDQAMYGDLLLSLDSKEKMYTSYPEYNYTGYSVWTYTYPFSESKSKIMERRGSIEGANVVLLRILSTNRTIVILSNNNKFDSDSFGNREQLKEALLMTVDK